MVSIVNNSLRIKHGITCILQGSIIYYLMTERAENNISEAPLRVGLGERFYPFVSFGHSREISLDTGAGFVLPLHAVVSASAYEQRTVLTPYNPGLGYTITQQDFDLEERIEKLKALPSINIPIDMVFGVNIHANGFALEQAGLKRRLGLLDPSLDAYCKGLYLILSIPMSVATEDGKYIDYALELKSHAVHGPGPHPSIAFNTFYPTDTGPLPTAAYPVSVEREGFFLALPNDENILRNVGAKFVWREPKGEQKA